MNGMKLGPITVTIEDVLPAFIGRDVLVRWHRYKEENKKIENFETGHLVFADNNQAIVTNKNRDKLEIPAVTFHQFKVLLKKLGKDFRYRKLSSEERSADQTTLVAEGKILTSAFAEISAY